MKCIKMFLGNIVTIALPRTPMTGLVSPLGAAVIYSLIVSLLRPSPETLEISEVRISKVRSLCSPLNYLNE